MQPDLPEKLKDDLLGIHDFGATELYLPSSSDVSKLLKALESVREQLFKSPNDQALAYLADLLQHQGTDELIDFEVLYGTPHLFDILIEALRRDDLVRRAAGRPSLPSWMIQVSLKLIAFYVENVGEARPYYSKYNPDEVSANLSVEEFDKALSQDKPGNEFTKWFHYTMKTLFPTAVTDKNCQTILEKHRKIAPKNID